MDRECVQGRLGDNYIKFDINTDKTASTIFVYEKRYFLYLTVMSGDI